MSTRTSHGPSTRLYVGPVAALFSVLFAVFYCLRGHDLAAVAAILSGAAAVNAFCGLLAERAARSSSPLLRLLERLRAYATHETPSFERGERP